MKVQVKSFGGYQGEGVGPRALQGRHPIHTLAIVTYVKNWATAVELLHHLCPTVFSAL